MRVLVAVAARRCAMSSAHSSGSRWSIPTTSRSEFGSRSGPS